MDATDNHDIIKKVKPTEQPRIIITTAGFGDGHNSAANNLAEALEDKAEVEVIDPCAIGAPWINNKLRRFYRFITTHTPRIWYRIYSSVEKHDFSKKRLPMMRKPEDSLKNFMLSFEPAAVVSTYPLYPYFYERAFQKGIPRIPVFTVITDSIEINGAWKKAPSDYYLVTDEFTKKSLVEQDLDDQSIIVTGFCVNPKFIQMESVPSDDPCSPFRVLFFPTTKKSITRRIMRAILNSHPTTQVTVVLGRNVRKLYDRVREIQIEFPDRVHIKGWTRRVPELLCSHHLTIGKAGGATVHEAIATACPMLIHHLVPGQEEGNLALLETIGGGYYTETHQDIQHALTDLLENNAQKWRTMKRSLTLHAKPAGAITAANFILNHLSKKP